MSIYICGISKPPSQWHPLATVPLKDWPKDAFKNNRPTDNAEEPLTMPSVLDDAPARSLGERKEWIGPQRLASDSEEPLTMPSVWEEPKERSVDNKRARASAEEPLTMPSVFD